MGRWVIVVWFVGLATVPLLLLTTGVRPAAVENRDTVPPPRFSAGRLLDTSLFAEVTAWFADRLPGRDRVIAADAWIDYHMLGDSPSVRVLLGEDRWLYLREGVSVACVDEQRIQAAVDDYALAVRIAAVSGKRLLLVVAPNKAAVYPEHLGPHAAATVCSVANRAAFRALVAGVPGFLDTWALLEDAKATSPGLLYHQLDTHWTSLGAGVVGEAIVEGLVPGLWEPAAFARRESEERRGDLSVLVGLPLHETAQYWTVQRAVAPAITSEQLGRGVEAVISTVAGLPTTGTTALMLHDSTGNPLTPLLRPYFEGLTTVRFQENAGTFGSEAGWFAARVSRADMIFLVTVERRLLDRLLRGDLVPNLVAALADDLPHREVALGAGAAGPAFGTRWDEAAGELVATGEAAARVRFSVPGSRDGTRRFLVVRLDLRSRGQVTLAAADGTETVPALTDTLAAREGSVVFYLDSLSAGGELELDFGTKQGSRVSQILVVEIPDP